VTVFHPCIGCTERNNCDIKRGVAAALRGQPTSMVRIKCKLPFTKFFPPGTRVSVMAWDYRWRRDHDGELVGRRVPATMVQAATKKRGKLLLCLDEPVMFADESTVQFVAAWPKDVIKLDEPLAELCDCGRPLVNGDCQPCRKRAEDEMRRAEMWPQWR
jgi:hypothetical protein